MPQKTASASAALIRDGRHIADMVAQVSMSFDGVQITGHYRNAVTGLQQGRVYIRPDEKTNGPWVDLAFIDSAGSQLALIQNHVSPIWECGSNNSTVYPGSHDVFEVAMTQDDWDKLSGIQLLPHGGWREDACR
jgi:hypothetical protein